MIEMVPCLVLQKFSNRQIVSSGEPIPVPAEPGCRDTLRRANDHPILNPSLSRVKRPLTLALSPEYRGEGIRAVPCLGGYSSFVPPKVKSPF